MQSIIRKGHLHANATLQVHLQYLCKKKMRVLMLHLINWSNESINLSSGVLV